MKKLLFLSYIFLIQFSYASECSSKATCKEPFIYIDTITNTLKGDLNCTLPSENAKMRIIAKDVFEADGTLKTYFGWDETVCDVLGWMNEGAKNSLSSSHLQSSSFGLYV